MRKKQTERKERRKEESEKNDKTKRLIAENPEPCQIHPGVNSQTNCTVAIKGQTVYYVKNCAEGGAKGLKYHPWLRWH